MSRSTVRLERATTRRPDDHRTRRTRWLALLVLCLGDLMIVLDATIVNVALPSIREDLGFSETSLAWVVNAYLLTFGGFLLLGGRLGDLFGHRRLFLIGIALFTLASLACGLATLAGDAGRRARGAGPRRRGRLGGRALADHDALHRAGRAREGDGRLRLRRRRAAAASACCSAASSPTSLSWHWIFLVNVPIGIAVVVALAAAAARRRAARPAAGGSTSPARSR